MIIALKRMIARYMADLPQKAGLLYGIPAYRFLDGKFSIQTLFADGIVWEVDCSLEEERAIIAATKPVDYVRRPGRESTIFIWYKDPGDWHEQFTNHHFDRLCKERGVE